MNDILGVSNIIEGGLARRDNVTTAIQLGKTIKTAKEEGDDKKLKETLADFEAIMINLLMNTMRKTIPESGLFSESNSSGRSIYYSMFDMEVSKIVAKRGGFGLAKIMYDQMNRQKNQGTQHNEVV